MKKIYLVAVIAALLTAFSVYQFSESIEEKAKEKVQGSVNVVVAAMPIAENTIITKEMLQLKQISEELTSSEITTDISTAIGKIVKYPLASGEPVYTTRLYEVGAKEGAQLSYEINKGMRAVTIGVDSVSGVSGYLKKGDRVDLVAHFTKESRAGEKMIMENLLVLRTGTLSQQDQDSEYTTITLEVTPEQASEINFIVANALIRLTLKSPLN